MGAMNVSKYQDFFDRLYDMKCLKAKLSVSIATYFFPMPTLLYIVGQKSNDTSIHSWLPFNEKSTPGKNKDIQVYIRMSTKSDINLRMVTLMST